MLQFAAHLLITTLFAAHALLGCAVHSRCDDVAADHEHAHAAHQPDATHEHHHGDPSTPSCPCAWERCAFVKSQSVRVDVADELCAVSPALPPELPRAAVHQVASLRLSTALDDASSATKLFVWHCALLI